MTEGIAATDATNARFVSVTVRPMALATILPALFFGGSSLVTTGASAVAGFDQVVCNVTPLFVCNPFEIDGMSYSQATQALQEAAADQRPQAPAGTEEHRYTITDRGTATLRGIANDDIVWAFNAIPDRPPTIALAKDPEPQARGALALSYKVEDDYGVTEAHATFALKDTAGGGVPVLGGHHVAGVLLDDLTALAAAHGRHGLG